MQNSGKYCILYRFKTRTKQKYNFASSASEMAALKFYFLILTGCVTLVSGTRVYAACRYGFQCPEQAGCLLAGDTSKAPCGTCLVINEIMADPTPVTGLPDAEWIELLNTGNAAVNPGGWKLTVGSVTRTLPDSLIEAGTFRIVCSAKASAMLRPWGSVAALSSLPALRNSGNRVILTDKAGTVHDQVDYSDGWYNDPLKKNGGWSLERIDPGRSCGQRENWIASLHPEGGTPGTVNSVFRENRDVEQPRITDCRAVSRSMAEISFSEPMDTLALGNKNNYRLSDGWGHPVKVQLREDTFVSLTWDQPLTANKTYRLEMETLTDACGNLLADPEVDIGWVVLEPGDVVINEVLFNPWPSGSDFVEILNVSSKSIEAQRLLIASRDEYGQIKKTTPLKPLRTWLPPGGYLVLTADTASIRFFYSATCLACLAQLPSLPAYNNDRGTVVLLSDSLMIIDEFTYSEEMHHPLLTDPEGISLERVHPGTPAGQTGNWQSASSLCGFATPGYQNSCYSNEPVRASRVYLEEHYFSPNQDGHNDEMILSYQTGVANPVGNCTLYDTNGLPVVRLANNALLGSGGTITWNGKDGNGRQLPPGPYILLFEIFNPEGYREVFKKAVILATPSE